VAKVVVKGAATGRRGLVASYPSPPPTMSSLRAPRSVSMRNLDEKASNVFLASYLLR